MTCARFLEQVHAYAIGALDAADRARFEAHLDGSGAHDGCFEALADALETAAALDRMHAGVEPGAAVRDALFASIDGSGAEPVRAPQPQRRVNSGAVFGWGLALAASIALVLVYRSNTALEQRVAKDGQQLAQLTSAVEERTQCRAALEKAHATSAEARDVLALLDAPATRLVAFAPQGERALRATAVVDASGGRAYVMGGALPALPGKEYQLWVIRGAGAPIPAGFVHAVDGGAAMGEFDARILEKGRADALAVSIEPAGGSAAPTEVVLVAKL